MLPLPPAYCAAAVSGQSSVAVTSKNKERNFDIEDTVGIAGVWPQRRHLLTPNIFQNIAYFTETVAPLTAVF